jgi:hypothetical protein
MGKVKAYGRSVRYSFHGTGSQGDITLHCFYVCVKTRNFVRIIQSVIMTETPPSMHPIPLSIVLTTKTPIAMMTEAQIQ